MRHQSSALRIIDCTDSTAKCRVINLLAVIGGLNDLVLLAADGKCDNNMAHLAKFLSENMSRHEKVMDESIDVVGGVEQNVPNAVLV